jgi:hypothetical protein
MALALHESAPMVAAVRTTSASDPAVSALILSIETKAILLLDRLGSPTSSIAPALRLGYIATAVTVDDRGDVLGYLAAPMTVDPGQASHALVNLAITQTSMRGPVKTVGLIGDDASAVMVRAALHDLRTSGDCDRWIEVLDPAVLRSRLGRLLSIIEPVDIVRDEIFSGWDLALAFEPGAIHHIIDELERRQKRLEEPYDVACATVVDYLQRHRTRADYGALRRQGIEIPIPSTRHHEYLPLRMTRSRCRPITLG